MKRPSSRHADFVSLGRVPLAKAAQSSTRSAMGPLCLQCVDGSIRVVTVRPSIKIHDSTNAETKHAYIHRHALRVKAVGAAQVRELGSVPREGGGPGQPFRGGQALRGGQGARGGGGGVGLDDRERVGWMVRVCCCWPMPMDMDVGVD